MILYLSGNAETSFNINLGANENGVSPLVKARSVAAWN